MTVSFIIFIVAVILLCTYIVLKQLEISLGVSGTLSRVLAEKSPVHEARFESVMDKVDVWRAHMSEKMKVLGFRTFAQTRATIRGLVVLVAAKMVRLVKGEKLLFSQTAPSLYLKRLKNEMEKPEEETTKDSVFE